MLIIVIANPIEFTIVNAVPLVSGSVFVATRVENKGESAITTNPQKIKKLTKIKGLLENTKGEIRQHKPDNIRKYVAVFFSPK